MSTATSYDTYPVTTENRAHYEAVYNPPAMVDGEYRYEVLVLGTRGAGKTTFLAAFYKQLSTPNVDRNNFWVELRDDRQRKFLVNTYHQLTNPNADWPPGSANVNEYEFRFCHPMDGRALPLFRFRYLDYPGGYLTDDVDGADSFDIAQITQKAHSILVLIDGQKVLQNIEELPIRGSSLDKDLDILIPMLNRCVHLPVHFVVTKWDVLETRRYTLARVRDELRRNSSFRNFMDWRAARQMPLHLIPVSAVGDNFAIFDPSEMRMKKQKNGTAEPYHLELPIGLTITDQLLLLKSGLTNSNILTDLFKIVLGFFGILTRSISILPTIVPDAEIYAIAALMGMAVGRPAARIKQKIERRIRTIKDQNSAVEATVWKLASQLNAFQAQFPESNLTRKQ